MNQMGYNVLRRAQDSTKITNGLAIFFSQHGVDISQVERDPTYYQDLIMEYSRQCINNQLFEESRSHMEDEFSRLCDFHRKHEDELVKRFFSITNEMIMNEVEKRNEHAK